MSDFDLSDALPSPLGLEDSVFEPCCADMTPHRVPDVQDRFFSLDDGLDMVVSHNPQTMEHVATLLLAVSKMKKFLSHGGRKLSDSELCSVIMDNLVEETIVENTENVSTGQGNCAFIRLDSEEVYTLCDDKNKDVVQREMNLEAVTLSGGYGEHKVNFKLARYTGCPDDGETVRLSITNTNLHISCSMKDNEAILKLEKHSKQELQEISNSGDMSRFLFYKRYNGTKSIITFESVMCRDWYISTSRETESEPVEMCKVDTAQRNTRFKLKCSAQNVPA